MLYEVITQIRVVDLIPDLTGGGHRLLFRQAGIVVEVAGRIGKGALAKTQETLYVPSLQQGGVGVDEDGKVDKVRYKYPVRVMGIIHAALQHVQAFQDENIGLFD